MRHVAVFPQPIFRFHFLACLVKYSACRLGSVRLRFCGHLCNEGMAVFVVRHFFIVDKEVDAGSEEVHSRSLEELVATATAFFLTFLQ